MAQFCTRERVIKFPDLSGGGYEVLRGRHAEAGGKKRQGGYGLHLSLSLSG